MAQVGTIATKRPARPIIRANKVRLGAVRRPAAEGVARGKATKVTVIRADQV